MPCRGHRPRLAERRPLPPKGVPVPNSYRFAVLASLLAGVAILLMLAPAPCAARDITFSGYSWSVVSGALSGTDDPNRFSDDEKSVWVDGAGRLHLRLRRDGDSWYSAEVLCTTALGYGTYSFALDGDMASLDPNVVVGLFTWSDDDAFDNREIDVEFSRWGDPAAPDAQFAIQPYAAPGHLARFNVPSGVRRSWYSFRWEPETVTFAGYASAIFRSGVPPAGDARVHINIWLVAGRAPIGGRDAEVVLERFVFGPRMTQASTQGIDAPAPQALR